MIWECKIIKADNGFVIEYQEETEDNRFETKRIVVEGGDEQEEMTGLLYAIAEFFGENYNKFAGDNLNITWDKKGHKIE
jgi:hypothetical protein